MRARNTLTFEQRQERRRKAKEKPAKNYYELQKYKTLKYKYALIEDEAKRQQMQEAALKIHTCERRAVQDLITIGQELIAVKALLPDRFTEWIDEEFGYSNGSAHDFMNMAIRYSKFPKFGNLGISSARLLSPPSVPDAAIVEAIELAETEGKITLAKTREIIGYHRPPKPKQLTSPTREEDTIDAEYTVMPSAPAGDLVRLRHELRLKMIDGAAHKVFMPFLTRDEHDELFIALTRALEGRESHPLA